MQPQWEVADVLRLVNIELPAFSIHQQKTLRALKHCRTAALGGHVDSCSECGVVRISYNSCRNRHCPKCQGHKRQEWMEKRKEDLLPCTYYHVVFTLPQELNPLALHRPALVYDALFNSVWATLHQFGKKEAMQMGMIAVLHTWGQNLSLHPHLHCIVPGGGINKDGQWKPYLRSNKYLFSVKALSKVFRAKYVQQLRDKGVEDQPLIDSLFRKEWVVYAKRPFGGPRQVIEYLGRYTHKVAISNQRIVQVDQTGVGFAYKDYRSSGQTKQMTLTNDEFVRRFAQHILPRRFVRIRHYGILSSSWKRGKLQALQTALQVSRPTTLPQTHLRKCPCCKTGTLITIEVFGSRGPPEKYLLKTQPAPVPQP
jgi:hypothetical protein